VSRNSSQTRGLPYRLPIFAKGDADIYLRNNSPSEAIRSTLGNDSYAGTARRYNFEKSESFNSGNYSDDGGSTYVQRTVLDGYVDVGYRGVNPMSSGVMYLKRTPIITAPECSVPGLMAGGYFQIQTTLLQRCDLIPESDRAST
jgi:hypothetical protein